MVDTDGKNFKNTRKFLIYILCTLKNILYINIFCINFVLLKQSVGI